MDSTGTRCTTAFTSYLRAPGLDHRVGGEALNISRQQSLRLEFGLEKGTGLCALESWHV